MSIPQDFSQLCSSTLMAITETSGRDIHKNNLVSKSTDLRLCEITVCYFNRNISPVHLKGYDTRLSTIVNSINDENSELFKTLMNLVLEDLTKIEVNSLIEDGQKILEHVNTPPQSRYLEEVLIKMIRTLWQQLIEFNVMVVPLNFRLPNMKDYTPNYLEFYRYCKLNNIYIASSGETGDSSITLNTTTHTFDNNGSWESNSIFVEGSKRSREKLYPQTEYETELFQWFDCYLSNLSALFEVTMTHKIMPIMFPSCLFEEKTSLVEEQTNLMDAIQAWRNYLNMYYNALERDTEKDPNTFKVDNFHTLITIERDFLPPKTTDDVVTNLKKKKKKTEIVDHTENDEDNYVDSYTTVFRDEKFMVNLVRLSMGVVLALAAMY